MRKVKDAYDLNDKEKIYFRGHAAATYTSDGKTVEQDLSELSAEVGKKVDADFVNNAIAAAITTTLNTEV